VSGLQLSGGDVAEGLIVNGFSGAGIAVSGSGNRVAGDYLGTDAAGTGALGNVEGVLVAAGATANTVGGTAAGSGNVISGNGTGVVLTGAGTSANVVLGNLIGTDKNGTVRLGNAGAGVLLQAGAAANTVGPGNVISANGTGVQLSGGGTSANVVLGNLIGTDKSGTANLGNSTDGVRADTGASRNTVGGTAAGAGNVIAFNATGVDLVGLTTVQDSALGNSLFANTGPGIVLNGPANYGQNAPRLTTVTGTAGGTTVGGSLSSGPGTYRLEFFASPPGGPAAQGKLFLGFAMVTVSGTVPQGFTATGLLPVPSGWVVTATATNLTSGPSFGDTSAFCAGLAGSLQVSVSPNPVHYSGSAQPVTLHALLPSGASGSVTFQIVPARGGPPILIVSVGMVNGVAARAVSLPPALGPGTYLVLATFHDPTETLPDSFGQTSLVVIL
jgi:titin